MKYEFVTDPFTGRGYYVPAQLNKETQMNVIEKYLRFEGLAEDALSFVESMREIQDDTGIEFPKVFRDFIFSIEVALQREGVLDENFTRVDGLT